MLRLHSMLKKWCSIAALVLVLLSVGEAQSIAVDKFNQAFGTAIDGYDTVAYHTENRAVKGKSEFSYQWNDANWHFVKADHRDLFAADPERYAPQFGGLCASSLAFGLVIRANPTEFKIVDGKLYFNKYDSGTISLNQKKIKMAHEEWAKKNKKN